ncbi:hypothetical protein ACISN8_08515, partial [Campylobacter jejuni]
TVAGVLAFSALAVFSITKTKENK